MLVMPRSQYGKAEPLNFGDGQSVPKLKPFGDENEQDSRGHEQIGDPTVANGIWIGARDSMRKNREPKHRINLDQKTIGLRTLLAA